MNALIIWLCLFAQDVATISGLPSEEECIAEIEFHTARLQDDFAKSTQLENEAKAMIDWWFTALGAVQARVPDRRDPDVSEIVGLRPTTFLERLAHARKLRTNP